MNKLFDKKIWIDVSDLNLLYRRLKKFNDILADLEIEHGGTFGSVKTSLLRYGLSQFRDSIRWVMLEINNKNGWYRHPYKFASLDARPWIVEAELKRDNKGKIKGTGRIVSRTRKMENIDVKKKGDYGEVEKYLWEVDNTGRFSDDINSIMIEGKDLNGEIGNRNTVFFRKIDAEDVYQGDELKQIASNITQEWTFFKDDFISGYLHPLSHTWKDYQEAHERKDWGYKNLKKISTPQKGADGAFDREALKDPGNFQYRGKKVYYDQNEDELREEEPRNYYPAISILGLTDYLIDLITKQLKEEEEMKVLKLYPEFDLKNIKFRELGEEQTKEKQ